MLGVIDHFVAMLNTVPRVEAELGNGGLNAPRLLSVASADDEIVVMAKLRLQVRCRTALGWV